MTAIGKERLIKEKEMLKRSKMGNNGKKIIIRKNYKTKECKI